MDKIDLTEYLQAHLEHIKEFLMSLGALALLLVATATTFDNTELMVLIGYAVYRVGWFLWRNPVEYHETKHRRREDYHA